MLIHIVLIKLKEGTTENQIKELYENIIKLKEKINGINSISGGHDISVEKMNHDFTYAFVMEFEDSKTRDDYLPHPAHQSVVKKYVNPVAADVLILDYKI